MKVVFLSNYYNHHQQAFSNRMYQLLDGQYSFIASTTMSSERAQLGYKDLEAPFLLQLQNAKKTCIERIENADIVIFGSASTTLIQNHLRQGKLVFQYSERIYKQKPPFYEMPVRALKYYFDKGRYSNIYLLCASAYTSADYNKTHTFSNREYKWGYFPETKKYNISELMEKKDRSKILWVGRFLDWKHPDDALLVAAKLKDAGYHFTMDIVGSGVMDESLKQKAESLKLSAYVNFVGSYPPDQVRSLMEKAGIYLFTSDRYEGWGAVLNESMNSACAVVASHAIGAVPYLMKQNENGLIYYSGNVDDLYNKVKYLLEYPVEQEKLGKAAYKTISELWNSDIAAERLIHLSEHLLAGEKYPILYQTGPCSRAEIIEDDWFRS